MPYPLTVAQQIQIGQISMYLSLTDITKKKFLEPLPYFEQQLSLLIAMETDCLKWQYELNPIDSTLFPTGNYLLALCGRYAIEAQAAINTGGVVVTPVDNVGQYLVVSKAYPQFVVGESGSPMSAGDTVLVITDNLIVPESAEGQVTVHVDGGEFGQQLIDRSSYTPVYASGQYTITFNQGVIDGNLIMIDYPIRKTLVYQSGTPSPSSATIYTAVIDGAATETLVDTDGNIFPITLGTQGLLNIELAGQDQDNVPFAGNWQYYVNNLTGTITLALSNGGIYFSYAGGDINSNIVIQANDGLGGVEMQITGFSGKTITANAKFNYSPFNF